MKGVELVEANPGYAHVRFIDGRVKTMSISDLAPAPEPEINVLTEDSSLIFDETNSGQREFKVHIETFKMMKLFL